MECYQEGPWKEVEDIFLKSKSLYYPYYYANKFLNSRWLEFENRIENLESISEENMSFIYEYANSFLKQSWEKLEFLILRNGNPWYAYYYCYQIINQPCQRLEGLITTSPKMIYLYSKNVLKKRWKNGERFLNSNPYYNDLYKRDIKNGNNKFPVKISN